MCIYSYIVGLHVYYLVGSFIYVHSFCMQAIKALVRLCICAGSSEPSLVAYAISTQVLLAYFQKKFSKDLFLATDKVLLNLHCMI